MNRRTAALVGAATALAVSLSLEPAASGAAAREDLGQTQRVSVGVAGAEPDGESYTPVVSANGRYVAFESDATNLVADDTNEVGDVSCATCAPAPPSACRSAPTAPRATS